MDLSKMMGKFQEMRDEMEKSRQKLDRLFVEGEAGGGMVRVKATASQKIVKVEIDTDLINHQDKEMLEDLVAAAVNKALDKAEQASKEEMARHAKGQLGDIDLSQFGL